MNKCGVCDGPLVAVKSDDGQQCCVNGVKDTAGECCASGVRDAVGVCDGQNESVQQGVTLGLGALPANYTQAAVQSFYRWVWNLFYAEYLLFPLL